MSNFVDWPLPWYNYVIMIPIYIILEFLGNELLRTYLNPFGLICAFLSLITIVIQSLFWKSYVFLPIKAYSLAIPLIILSIFRIRNQPHFILNRILYVFLVLSKTILPKTFLFILL